MKKIYRILVWFNDENGAIHNLVEQYFGLSTLLDRLVNEFYTGKKIKFVNIHLSTKESYLKYRAISVNSSYYYGGNLMYYGEIEFKEFYAKNKYEKNEYIWAKACNYLMIAAKETKNTNLVRAIEIAEVEGLKIKLNTDYKVLELNTSLFDNQVNIAIYIKFEEHIMCSELVIKQNDTTIFNQKLDSAKNGNEFFLVMYTKIEVSENQVIIKGKKGIDCLPLRVNIDKQIFL